MIQKLTFDTYDINSLSSSDYRIQNSSGFNPSLKTNYVDIPRTDYRTFVSAYSQPKIRAVNFLMTAPTTEDFIDQEVALMGIVDQSYTFTAFREVFAAGVPVTQISLQFEGFIKSVTRVNEGSGQISFGEYEIIIESANPFLEATTSTSQSTSITPAGYVYVDHVYNYAYSGATNTITVENVGTAPAYPLFTLTGGGTNWSIRTDRTDVDNQIFLYNDTIADNDTVTINPIFTDPQKVRDSSGNIKINQTNFNWEALEIPANSSVTFTVNIGSGITANSAIQIDFRSQYWGL